MSGKASCRRLNLPSATLTSHRQAESTSCVWVW